MLTVTRFDTRTDPPTILPPINVRRLRANPAGYFLYQDGHPCAFYSAVDWVLDVEAQS